MTASFRSIITKHALSLILWSLLCVGLYLTSLYSYILFHIVAESFSIVIAFSLFMIAWNTRHLTKNNYILFLGIAFFFAGLIDFVHTLAYKGMGIFIGYDANLPTQLWIIARYLQGLSFLVAPWFIDRKLSPLAIFGFYISVTLLLLAAAFSGTLFPDCFIEGKGLTPFKIVSEYIICFILICSFVLLLRRREDFDQKILQLIKWSILCTIVSELAFTFYVSVYGLSNLIGHCFKIFAFYLIYRAIIVTGLENPYGLLFYDLQKHREELQIIMDASPMMIFYKDRENKLIRVNKAVAAATGLPKESIEGKSVFEIYPNQTKNYWEDDKEVIASGKPKIGIIEPIETATGTRWIQADKIPYRDIEGHIIGIIGFAIDITEGKQVEEALLKSKKQYDRLVTNIPVGVYLLHTTPTKGFAFDYISPQMAAMLDLSTESIMTNPQVAFQPIHPEELEAFVSLNRDRIEAKQPFLWEGRAIVKGIIKWLRIESQPELLDNGDVLWHGVVSDITKRRQVEEALGEERRRLQQALDEVRTLRGIVPICANCKKIRDDKGFWNQVERYVSDHTEAEFSHGICPDCAKALYPELYEKEQVDEKP